MDRDKKIKMGAPCLYEEWDDVKKKSSVVAPAVNCGYDCANCGWNPKEAQRRLENGAWMYSENGIRHLLFPKREVEAGCHT